jgi:hypothetical protein
MRTFAGISSLAILFHYLICLFVHLHGNVWTGGFIWTVYMAVTFFVADRAYPLNVNDLALAFGEGGSRP